MSSWSSVASAAFQIPTFRIPPGILQIDRMTPVSINSLPRRLSAAMSWSRSAAGMSGGSKVVIWTRNSTATRVYRRISSRTAVTMRSAVGSHASSRTPA